MHMRFLTAAAAAALLISASPLWAQQDYPGTSQQSPSQKQSPKGDDAAPKAGDREKQKSPEREGSGARTQKQEERSGQTMEQRERSGQMEKRERSGETPDKERSGQMEKRERSGETPDRERSGQTIEKKERERSGEVIEKEGKGKTVHIDESKRKIVRERIANVEIKRIPRADFDVKVGVRIPRTVTVYDLPPTIIEIVPEYRRYKYVAVGDVILIIDPDTLEIVDVIPV